MLGIFAIVGIIVSDSIIGVFRNDPQVIEIGVFALRCQCIACFFLPLSVCTNMMFQSVGKSGGATFLATLRSGLCFVPLILVLPHFIGLMGVQISQTISDILTFVLSLPMMVAFIRVLPPDSIEEKTVLKG